MSPSTRTVLAWLFAATYFSVFATAYLIWLRGWPWSWVQAGIRLWGFGLLRIVNIRLEFVNASTLETRAPRIVIFNHQGSLDFAWCAAICPPAPLAIGKKEVIWIPFFNLVWWALGFIRIDRKNPTRAVAGLKRAADVIVKDSRSLFIAPEGTRTRDGSILPFKKGAFHLAIQSGAPICPIVVAGAFELLPKQKWIAQPGVIRVKFLEPVSPAGVKPEELEQWMAGIRERMITAYDELRAAAPAANPVSV